MRQGSNFVGTEEELLALMKSSLKHFTSDWEWLFNMMQTKSEQEYINICESIAECADRGYIKNITYTLLMNKTMMFKNTTPDNDFKIAIPPEELPEPEPPKPFELTEAGKYFLNS